MCALPLGPQQAEGRALTWLCGVGDKGAVGKEGRTASTGAETLRQTPLLGGVTP